jgi:membrane fusion protein, multidrug efflux system
MEVEERREPQKTNGHADSREKPASTAAQAEKPRSPGASRPFAILGILVLAVVLGIGGYSLLTAGNENTDDAQVATDMVPIGTRVAGQVTRVAIAENQTVKKGALIAQIDDADYAAKVKQADAELASAQAQAAAADAQVEIVQATSKGGLTSARAAYSGSSVGVASAQAQIEAAKAAIVRADADVRRTDTDLKRAQELRAANAVPEERLDNAKSAHDAAQATFSQANAQLAAAEEAKRAASARVSEAEGRVAQSAPIDSQIAVARANADLARARVASATAALELAKLQLTYTRVLAPADGIASKLTVHEGQLVAIGQPVIELLPLATYVVANFKETQVGKMKPGQPATISIDAFPHREFRGTVESLSGGTGASFSLLPADNASGNFVKVVQRVPVRITWIDPPSDLVLRAGLSADVTVNVGR